MISSEYFRELPHCNLCLMLIKDMLIYTNGLVYCGTMLCI